MAGKTFWVLAAVEMETSLELEPQETVLVGVKIFSELEEEMV